MGSVAARRDRGTVCRRHGVLAPCPYCACNGAPWFKPWFADLCAVIGHPERDTNLNEPCTPVLLADPSAPLPSHLCFDVACATTEAFVRRRLGNLGGETFAAWRQSWPLPVNAFAAQDWAEPYRHPRCMLNPREVPQLGLGFGWLGLVVERESDLWRVTLLGPVTVWGLGSARAQSWQWADPVLQLTGIDPACQDAVSHARELRRWYRELLLGQPVGSGPNAGRPRGSGQPVTPKLVAQTYWAYVRRHGTRPSQETLAPEFGLSARQFKARLAGLRDE